MWNIITYIIIFFYGLLIGSFLNVVIFRVPKKESVSKKRSHCMSCGYQLAWFDLIPLFSWLFLGGKCRKCKKPISAQYPIIEALNAFVVLLVFYVSYGFDAYLIFEEFELITLLNCFLASALIALSVIDERTKEIPLGINVFIFVLGTINIIYRLIKYGYTEADIWVYILGFFAISVPMLVIILASKGRALGGGDMKLMAAAGLLIGWKMIILAFCVGCIVGSVIHIARMKISKVEHLLALGPYLSVGIMVAVLWGQKLWDLYFGLFKR